MTNVLVPTTMSDGINRGLVENTDHAYPSKLGHALNDLREQNHLCDITITLGGEAFHAHKAVLAAASSYFMAMFTSGFKESGEKEISLEGSSEIFKVLLHFAYTGVLTFKPDNAYDVINMACYMQFTDVYKTCATLIEDCFSNKSKPMSMSVGDAFKIYELAKSHNCLADLGKSAERYMETNIHEMKRSDVVLQNANMAFLDEFLEHENLATAWQEKEVFALVIHWLKHDWENRNSHALDLLKKVRLGLVPKDWMKQLLSVELRILEIPECYALVEQVRKLQKDKEPWTPRAVSHPEFFSTRSTITAPISTLIGKAFSLVAPSSCKFQYFHTKEKQWKLLKRFAALPYSACYQSMISVDGTLYSAGGLDQRRELDHDELYADSDSDWSGDSEDSYRLVPVCRKHFYQYHAIENRWIQLAPMNKARNSFSMVQLNNYIYAIGGSNDMGYDITDVERFCLGNERWQTIAPLPIRCQSISVRAFNGMIILHGVTPEDVNPETARPQVKYVLLAYHPVSNRWQEVLEELHDINRERPVHPPQLVVHKETCYRVIYRVVPSDVKTPWYRNPRCKMSVRVLEVTHKDNLDMSVVIGDEVKQDFIPANRAGAFRIGDEVFISANSFSYNTGITIQPDQDSDVDLESWEAFNDVSGQGGIALFTFDRKQLEK